MNVASPTSDETVLAHDDADWACLHGIIEKNSLLRGDFTLSSGRQSKYLFQLRQTTIFPDAMQPLGRAIIAYMRRHDIHSIGGPELGAVPIVVLASFASALENYPLKPFFVRKARKGHGAQERIDGFVADGEVLLVDDVATTGGSILNALEGLKAEGASCTVRRALVIIDREEGAAENLSTHGIQLVSLFKKSDFEI